MHKFCLILIGLIYFSLALRLFPMFISLLCPHVPPYLRVHAMPCLLMSSQNSIPRFIRHRNRVLINRFHTAVSLAPWMDVRFFIRTFQHEIHLYIIYKASIHTSQRTQCVTITWTNQLILPARTIAVHSKNHKKHVNALYGQNEKLLLMLKQVVYIITAVLWMFKNSSYIAARGIHNSLK
jgi:hypothetical protein